MSDTIESGGACGKPVGPGLYCVRKRHEGPCVVPRELPDDGSVLRADAPKCKEWCGTTGYPDVGPDVIVYCTLSDPRGFCSVACRDAATKPRPTFEELVARVGPLPSGQLASAVGEHYRCPVCGPHAAVDEDGCCASCGVDCDCTIEPCRCFATPEERAAAEGPRSVPAEDVRASLGHAIETFDGDMSREDRDRLVDVILSSPWLSVTLTARETPDEAYLRGQEEMRDRAAIEAAQEVCTDGCDHEECAARSFVAEAIGNLEPVTMTGGKR